MTGEWPPAPRVNRSRWPAADPPAGRRGTLLILPLTFLLGAASGIAVLKAMSLSGPPPVASAVKPEVTAAPLPGSRPPEVVSERAPPACIAPVDEHSREERDFAQHAAPARSGLEPEFATRMVPKLGRAVTYMMRTQRAQLLEMRCEARTCVLRVLWPAAPARTPAVLAPEEPGCTIDMQPPFEEQRQARGPVRVSFYYQCLAWVEPAFESPDHPDAELSAALPTPGPEDTAPPSLDARDE